MLFKWQSQPVVLKTGWVRQLAEWDRQQKIPKKYQDNLFFFLTPSPTNNESKQHTPHPPSIFILVCIRTLESQDHILNVFFLGDVKAVERQESRINLWWV